MNKIIEKGDILKLTYPGGLHNHTEYFYFLGDCE